MAFTARVSGLPVPNRSAPRAVKPLMRASVPSLLEARVPERLAAARVRGPVVEAAPGVVLLRIPQVGRFLVSADGTVRVERDAGAGAADVRCFVDGPVAAARALLRGAIPLRAACVSLDGRAVALTGGSVTGKSGVAAALALRGHPVLADAVTVIDPDVAPVSPRPVLWPDLVEQLGLDPGAGELVRPALPKRAFELSPPAPPAPLSAVVIIRRDVLAAQPSAQRVTGWRKASAIAAATWHRQLVEPLGFEPALFERVTELAAEVDVISLVRPRDGCAVTGLADLVEEMAA